MTARAWLALAAAVASAACGVPLMKLPAGPGSPATDVAAAASQAVAACTRVTTISMELAVTGQVGGRRVRGRLLAGLASPASAYLEAPAPLGAPVFIFAASDGDATLLLPRERRVLEHGQPADVLEAVTGMALTPADLRATLTGCATVADSGAARRLGDDWRVVPGAGEVYLRRDPSTSRWRVVAVVHHTSDRPEWRVEYREFVGDLPRAIRITSTGSARFDLRLALSQVDINVPLDAATFRLAVPAGSQPVSLEELRDTGPLPGPPRSVPGPPRSAP